MQIPLVGFWLGWILNILFLFIFPTFFSSLRELFIAPIFIFLLGFVLSLPLHLLGRLLGRRRLQTWRHLGALSRWGLLAIFLSFLIFWGRSPYRHWKVSPDVLVYCLDGATWRIINPLIDKNILPNISKIRDEGASGDMISIYPSLSPVVWTTIATGVGPEKHGITSFYSTQSQLRTKRMWDVLEEKGQSVGIFRWLLTWPPHRVKGFIIPGILARDSSCYPQRYSFINDLRIEQKSGRRMTLVPFAAIAFKALRAGLGLSTSLSMARELGQAALARDKVLMHVAQRRAEVRLNTDIYVQLLRRTSPSFTTFYDNGTDVLCHFYWKYYEPELFRGVSEEEKKRYGRIIPDYYALVDKMLGRILEHIDSSTTLFVISDHGHKADPGPSGVELYPKAAKILEDLDLTRDYYGIALGSRTYIESVKLGLKEKAEAMEELAVTLSSIIIEETGKPLFKVTVEGDKRIDLNINDCDPSHTALYQGQKFALEKWVQKKPIYSGTHDLRGIFLARGPGIERDHRVGDVHLVDMAPTILSILGQPLSREFEGRVIDEVFTNDFLSHVTPSFVDSYGPLDPKGKRVEVDEKTMEKLRSLGYIR